MKSLAVVMEQPQRLTVSSLPIDEPSARDVVVATRWSGVSAGTEKLLYTGRMPSFPGMGYPLVPGYETIGTVVSAGPQAGLAVGANVFVPGARCFGRSVRRSRQCDHLAAADRADHRRPVEREERPVDLVRGRLGCRAQGRQGASQ